MTLFLSTFVLLICPFIVLILGMSRIGDNKKVSQIEMLPDEQLLVLISGKEWYTSRTILKHCVLPENIHTLLQRVF